MNYRNIHDLAAAVRNWVERLPEDIDLIVGIPRSGMLVANLLALRLDLPLADVDGFCEGRVLIGGTSPRGGNAAGAGRTLVVDDSICTGRKMRQARDRIRAAGRDDRVLYGAVYATPEAAGAVDVWAEIVPGPHCFEWNLMRQPLLNEACVDIDGVLCRDPTPEENDDGPRYRRFIEDVRPRYRPATPIGWLVTCRLEKYRAPTEAWLRAHGVAYHHLVMMDLPDGAARIAAGSHASYKAGVYKRCSALLFVESNVGQAARIAVLSGKPVLCTGTQQFFEPSVAAKTLTNAKRAVRQGRTNPLKLIRRIASSARSRWHLWRRVGQGSDRTG